MAEKLRLGYVYQRACGGLRMGNLKTVGQLCQEKGIDAAALAQRAILDESRALAILRGQWTPSPAERDRIAAALGLTRDEIAWGHSTPVQHLYGHGPQFGRTP